MLAKTVLPWQSSPQTQAGTPAAAGFKSLTLTSVMGMHAAETVPDHAGQGGKQGTGAILQLLIIRLVTFGKHSSVVSHRQRCSLSRSYL